MRRSRSLIAHWMLEEIGAPYRFHLLDLAKGEHKAPGYLAVNPMGKVPAIDHDGTVVTEAAAICAYLADAFPAAGLAPPPEDARRGSYYRWLFFGPGCLEPAIIDRMFQRGGNAPEGALGYGTFDGVLDVVESAVASGPYLLGDMFSAADVVLGSGLSWGMMTGAVPERPEIAAYVTRLRARPALQRVYAEDAKLVAALTT
ncbi:MAG: glutathione S-transferase family protein [Alphaproteobacteria bacterium]